MSYLAIEQNGSFIDHVVIMGEDNEVKFKDLLDMSYNEMKTYDYLEEFVACAMGAANTFFGNNDEIMVINLVGEDDVFIWGILIGADDNEGDLRYVLVDWKKDDKRYKYSSERA